MSRWQRKDFFGFWTALKKTIWEWKEAEEVTKKVISKTTPRGQRVVIPASEARRESFKPE
jgi:hypothetical protein